MTTRTLYYVPIEPFEGRYTKSWYQNFPIAFSKLFDRVHIIDGIPIHNDIKVGTFLDINSTVHYKNSQLMAISQLFASGSIKNTDCFFFGDIEFWGIESVRLMADMNKLYGVELTGFLHAASYTHEDAFSIAESYQKYTEVGWIEALDLVFVGSEYHKASVVSRRGLTKAQADKVIVTGNPMFASDYEDFQDVVKQRQVILPNRFDFEKRANFSMDVAEYVVEQDPSICFVVTTSHSRLRSNRPYLLERALFLEEKGVLTIREGLTKREYHQELAKSSLMLTTSIEENFGYCIAESMLYSTIPIMPKGLSHTELACDEKQLFYMGDLPFKVSFDVEAIGSRIIDLIDDHAWLSSQQAVAKERATHYLSAADEIAKHVYELGNTL